MKPAPHSASDTAAELGPVPSASPHVAVLVHVVASGLRQQMVFVAGLLPIRLLHVSMSFTCTPSAIQWYSSVADDDK